MGSVLSNLYRVIDLIIYIPKNVTKLPIRMTVIRVLRMLILFGLSVAPFVFFITINVTNYLGWLVWAFLSGIWAFVVFAAGNILCELSTTKEILERIRWMIKKA